MAKKSSIEKNQYRSQLISKYAAQRADLKKIINSKSKSPEDRFEASLKLAKLPRNSAGVRFRNRCIVTGRSRGVYRKFGLCRITLREMANSGLLPGVRKASW